MEIEREKQRASFGGLEKKKTENQKTGEGASAETKKKKKREQEKNLEKIGEVFGRQNRKGKGKIRTETERKETAMKNQKIKLEVGEEKGRMAERKRRLQWRLGLREPTEKAEIKRTKKTEGVSSESKGKNLEKHEEGI